MEIVDHKHKSQWNDFRTITTYYQATVLSTSPSLSSWRSRVSSPSPEGSPPSSGPTSFRHHPLVSWQRWHQPFCFKDKDGSDFVDHQPLVFMTKMALILMKLVLLVRPRYFRFQTILMIIGALVLSILAFTHEDIGGYEQLVRLFEWNQNEDRIQINRFMWIF